MPSASLDNVRVTSTSGRGIVCIDGGSLTVNNSAVVNCAATGVYVGGQSINNTIANADTDEATTTSSKIIQSTATLQSTDVVGNGIGGMAAIEASSYAASLPRGGNNTLIARGHSGIYLEQGNCTIDNCNVSRNTLTGLSAVSTESAVASVHHTDFVDNGTPIQMELPFHGSRARQLSDTASNTNSMSTDPQDETFRSSQLLLQLHLRQSTRDSSSTMEQQQQQLSSVFDDAAAAASSNEGLNNNNNNRNMAAYH